MEPSLNTLLRAAWLLAAIAAIALAPRSFAWSDHGSLLWPQFVDTPELLEPSLVVETLDAFIDAEAAGLENLLAEHESRTRDAACVRAAPR